MAITSSQFLRRKVSSRIVHSNVLVLGLSYWLQTNLYKHSFLLLHCHSLLAIFDLERKPLDDELRSYRIWVRKEKSHCYLEYDNKQGESICTWNCSSQKQGPKNHLGKLDLLRSSDLSKEAIIRGRFKLQQVKHGEISEGAAVRKAMKS
ncbi:hypothetical protein HPP92_008854 [Vanilla planifolia]|uniref:Uncharacterized protein n=1 Tax=Vanilla planifolia TaxID=51239 RepID=A0A835V455_VANPL|nr:hypothetical protein HPP92_008854 [Vanilla planifolia]